MSFVFKSLKFPENVGSDQVPNYVRFVPKIIKYGGTQSLRAGTNAVGAPSLGGGGLGGIAQSSIVPALDALLGVTHSNDPLKEYLDEMRLYMPKEHRELLNGLDEWSKNERTKININQESVEIINELIKEVHTFRDKHLEYARVYIYDQSLTNNSNSNIVGTGGTPFMKYLDKHLQETVPAND